MEPMGRKCEKHVALQRERISPNDLCRARPCEQTISPARWRVGYHVYEHTCMSETLS